MDLRGGVELDPLFLDSRGLAFGGPWTNTTAFFLFCVGVLLIMVITAAIAWRCLRPGAGAAPRRRLRLRR